MVIVYYVNTYYLDAAIETIQTLKGTGELHVLIEISPESKKTNIIDVQTLEGCRPIEQPERVLGTDKWELLRPYFEGVASIRFAVYHHKRSISFESCTTAFQCGKLIRQLSPKAVHFDSVSPRILAMIPWLYKQCVFITVHDPLPHSGEGSWKIRLTEFLYFRMAKGLFFYSFFASEQFARHYTSISTPRFHLRFQPFRFIQHYAGSVQEGKDVLFFGRILQYKGVDLLLSAIPAVLEKFPDQVFTIAGESVNSVLDNRLIDKYPQNIRLINRYIDTAELAKLIQGAKFIVCPYRDATQSGVLMTTYALGKMVAGTNIGAFPEYISDHVNGILMDPNPESIASKLIEVLTNDNYKRLEKNIQSSFSSATDELNRQCFLSAYSRQKQHAHLLFAIDNDKEK